MKECVICGISKDVLDFYRMHDKDDRYKVVCGECRDIGHPEPIDSLEEDDD